MVFYKKDYIPFHNYSELYKDVKEVKGEPVITLKPDYPFVITRFKIMNPENAQANFPHRHDFFQIIYIEHGEGQHIIDFETYKINPPSFFLIPPGLVHFWRLKQPLRGKIIMFPREFLIHSDTKTKQTDDLIMFNSLSRAASVHIPEKDRPKILDLVNGIWEEFLRNIDCSFSVLRSYTHILLVNLLRVYACQQEDNILNTSNTLVQKFRQLVTENYLTLRSVQEYADLMGISVSHFREIVRSVTGYSPGQIIRQEIIFEAKRRLANTDMTTTEISYTLNFEDASYFSRFFKRETGMTPLSFREKIRKKYKIKL